MFESMPVSEPAQARALVLGGARRRFGRQAILGWDIAAAAESPTGLLFFRQPVEAAAHAAHKFAP